MIAKTPRMRTGRAGPPSKLEGESTQIAGKGGSARESLVSQRRSRGLPPRPESAASLTLIGPIQNQAKLVYCPRLRYYATQ